VAARHRARVWIGVLVGLVVLLIAADRLGALVARSAAQQRLSQQAAFEGTPTVKINGIPFLTQAVRGVYRDVEVSGQLNQIGQIRTSALDVHLHGAHLPLGDVIRRDVKSVPVDNVAGTLTIPYPEVARLSEIPNLTITPQGSQLRATATTSLPVIGDDVTVTGVGVVTLVDGQIKIELTKVDAGPVGIPAALLPAVSSALSALIPLPTLPYGLH
jgi:LmeA-like phospholipid-binding